MTSLDSIVAATPPIKYFNSLSDKNNKDTDIMNACIGEYRLNKAGNRSLLGYGEAATHMTLTHRFVGSNPTTLVKHIFKMHCMNLEDADYQFDSYKCI